MEALALRKLGDFLDDIVPGIVNSSGREISPIDMGISRQSGQFSFQFGKTAFCVFLWRPSVDKLVAFALRHQRKTQIAGVCRPSKKRVLFIV